MGIFKVFGGFFFPFQGQLKRVKRAPGSVGGPAEECPSSDGEGTETQPKVLEPKQSSSAKWDQSALSYLVKKAFTVAVNK